jgi:hypothetical protein
MLSIDPLADPARQRLTVLRNELLQLHRTLLESERRIYERDIEKITSSNHMLSLLLHDPWFAWLHELSQFVVLIDEMLDAKEPATAVDAAEFLRQSRRLISPEEAGTGYARRYFEALQRDPDVVMAHARMRKVLTSLGIE